MTEQTDARPTPHTDALDTLGTIIDSNEKRDAIHLAVIPAQAGEPLQANEDVGLGADGKASATPASGQLVGKVDPFLTKTVMPGDWFWLVIYPREITSLRHVWTHPAFDNTEVEEALPQPTAEQVRKVELLIDPEMQEAQRILQGYADELDMSLDRLLHMAQDFLSTGGYHVGGSEAEGVYTGDDFWDAYDIYRKTTTNPHDRGGFISCSC